MAYTSVNSQKADLEQFYALLGTLEERTGGKRRLGECNGYMDWPTRGIYFFFQPGESRAGGVASRVVRVGTHALTPGSSSTLWGRLRQHRGRGSGSGNHRGSVFRLHVGAALQRRDPDKWKLETWGLKSRASREARLVERPLEEAVSAELGRMSILWLEVEDEPGPASDRAYLERNSIALLSRIGGEVDPASRSWLGRYSARAVIRGSGLWNVNHVFAGYEPAFLDVLEGYVDAMGIGTAGR